MIKQERRYLGLTLFAFFAVVVSYIASHLGMGNDKQVPLYHPFYAVFEYVALITGLALAWTNNAQDEYLKSLKERALKWSLLVTVSVVIANNSLYFFSDLLPIQATDIILLLLWSYYFGYKLIVFWDDRH